MTELERLREENRYGPPPGHQPEYALVRGSLIGCGVFVGLLAVVGAGAIARWMAGF